ncbi:MAG: short-chain alcohol dehydrogenase-like protein [Deltaproteobacteria bacterium]|jgi:NAD(P)-dependent dehydrogenase (short-subunit alcohol dehydrogenase family)|nr:short-chain alcohol dehydrogenase-like protein [Deltaproteobacteria bacterium]
MRTQDMVMRFRDKVAFITGGAVGFGRAFAKALAAEGAAIVIADIDGQSGCASAQALEADGHAAIAVECDVADEQRVEAAVAAAVDRFGGIDVLINNAGLHLLAYNQPFGALERQKLRELFDVNVIGIVNCTMACRRSMAARGGGVVLNIASMAGHMCITPYSVSKLAVRGLTIALATELAPDSIRVNAISPGLMATESAMEHLPQTMIDHIINNSQLIHRQGEMRDIVSAMLFLCSGESSFITGETIKVSGGYPLYL